MCKECDEVKFPTIGLEELNRLRNNIENFIINTTKSIQIKEGLKDNRWEVIEALLKETTSCVTIIKNRHIKR